MQKVIVCDLGFQGSRLDVSSTPRDRDHKMTPTPSGTLSMKDPTWRMGSYHDSKVLTPRMYSFFLFFICFPTEP